MRITLKCQPSHTLAVCELEDDEVIEVERGAMVAMSGAIDVHTGVGSGGLRHALTRKAAGEEGVFLVSYRAQVPDSWIAVAPNYTGDIANLDLDGVEGYVVTQGAFLACAASVKVSAKWAGFRSKLMREGFTMLHLSGRGVALVAARGGLFPLSLGPGETLIVDTGHIVAVTDAMATGMQVGPFGGVAEASLSGEGLAALFTGPGRVWIQTRSQDLLDNRR